jgi:cytochrome c oxidase subunit 2
MKGEENSRKQTNKINGFMLLVFLIGGLIGVYYCNERLRGKILGPSASVEGVYIDRMIYITLSITFVVFIITQVLLFWFAYKYQESDKRKAYFYPHNNNWEKIWTVVPSIALTVMVGFGLYYWFNITRQAPENAHVVEITGSQFKWEYRYPGKDKELGKKFYKNIDGANGNPLGQLWEDPANHDDIYLTGDDLHLVVNKPVKLVINSKDVIHDVGLAHFRMKMDAVPGTPTTMWFTPRFTTKQMKEKYGPAFTYEISCDQMCGQGHFGMRGTIIVETQEEYDMWMASRKPQYYTAFPEKAPGAQPAKADSVKVIAAVTTAAK